MSSKEIADLWAAIHAVDVRVAKIETTLKILGGFLLLVEAVARILVPLVQH